MLIDLTQKLNSQTPVYPGDPKSSLDQTAFIDKDTYNDHHLSTQMHVGTHVDAPLHMIPNGKMINQMALDLFMGKGVLVNCKQLKEISSDVLKGVNINPGDIVLFQTNFSDKYRTEKYFADSPFLTPELANELVIRKIRMIGLDFSGPDTDSSWPVHKILLGAQIPIIENLANLKELVNKNFEVMAFPLNIDSDASPVRVVAKID